ncbi:MAG: hypothetical protein MJY59_04520 [Bacteroidaceae bacterium]|nr:hypothetical protein [Bacteroidaceae bacterium]
MRKLLLAILCCVATSVFAQGQGGFGGGQFDPAQMVKRQADRIKQICELTDEQYEKVKTLYQKQSDEMRKSMEEGQQGQRMDREAMQKRREAQEAELKKILTEEQWKKYEEAQKQMRERRGQRGQGGPRGGFQGGPQGASQQ